ncbi:UNVERIFIED_CONTAM: hypothetical protein FKN15_057086 [Acipenser sinensis]
MDRNALAELLQALESRRDAEERRREERYTALIERVKGTGSDTTGQQRIQRGSRVSSQRFLSQRWNRQRHDWAATDPAWKQSEQPAIPESETEWRRFPNQRRNGGNAILINNNRQ